MKKLIDLIREQRRRLAGNDEVTLAHWANFDKDAPCRVQVGGAVLVSAPDEPFESFTKRVTAAAVAADARILWLENVT
jgi:hypothetical protein